MSSCVLSVRASAYDVVYVLANVVCIIRHFDAKTSYNVSHQIHTQNQYHLVWNLYFHWKLCFLDPCEVLIRLTWCQVFIVKLYSWYTCRICRAFSLYTVRFSSCSFVCCANRIFFANLIYRVPCYIGN